ncbi:MAG: DUF6514 family protein, partial [Ruthenibacterium sp.]
KRKFSQLGAMQQEKELTYALVSNGVYDTGYGVCVAEHSVHTSSTQTVKNITQTRKSAERVLLFLYENAITPAVLQDVLQDLEAQNFLQEVEEKV